MDGYHNCPFFILYGILSYIEVKCVKYDIEARTAELAKYIIDNKCTVRDAAKKFGISKSTVHTVGVT